MAITPFRTTALWPRCRAYHPAAGRAAVAMADPPGIPRVEGKVNTPLPPKRRSCRQPSWPERPADRCGGDRLVHSDMTGEGAKVPHQTPAGLSYASGPVSRADVTAGQRVQVKVPS